MSESACPPSDELKAFSSGKLSEEAFTRVAEHLAGCQSCADYLHDIDAAGETLVNGLRRVRSTESAENWHQHLLARLEQAALDGLNHDSAAPLQTPRSMSADGDDPRPGVHQIRCPHCHCPVPLNDEAAREVLCPACR